MNIDHFRADTRDAQIGETVWCFRRSAKVTVAKNDRWPWGTLSDRGGNAGLGAILNGDLLVACVIDAEADVSDWYGIDRSTVCIYRRAIRDLFTSQVRRRQSRKMLGRSNEPATREHARIAAARVDEIRRALAGGLTIHEAAAKCGVSRSTVYRAMKQ